MIVSELVVPPHPMLISKLISAEMPRSALRFVREILVVIPIAEEWSGATLQSSSLCRLNKLVRIKALVPRTVWNID